MQCRSNTAFRARQVTKPWFDAHSRSGGASVRITIVVLFALLPVVLLGQDKEKKLDACTLLSAADAASITGTTMWFVSGGGKDSCTYVDRKPALLRSTIVDRSLIFGMKRYKTEQAADKEWAKATAPHDQSEAFKESQVLSGIGDKAFLFGHVQDGKMGFAQIAVQKGTLILTLQDVDLKNDSSSDALIAVAKKIADQF